MTKKIFFFIILILCFCSITLILIAKKIKNDKNKPTTITLLNWSEYIKPELIQEFNKEYSGRFVLKQIFLSSNELAINKIKSGNKYDIAILSEYAIEQLKSNDLEKIDIQRLNNDLKEDNGKTNDLKFTSNFKNIKQKKDETEQSDIWEYNIPYLWGKLGFLYNENKLGEIKSLQQLKKILENPEHKVALYNNPFEVMFVGLKMTEGDISVNSKDDIQKSKEYLLDLKKNNPNLYFVTDSLLDRMKIPGKEHYDIVVSYSGDARYLTRENKNLKYYHFKKEEQKKTGTNIWFDGIVFPKESNKEGSYKFINFLLKKENNEKNIKFLDYNSPYSGENDDDLCKIDENDKIYKYNKEIKKEIANAWNEIYTYRDPKDKYLIFLSIFILFFYGFFYFILKK
ncbi:ABC-type spermidine/putrescine transport system substrate-binding protein [Candidatus Phytoplasma luffae]|uniref:ABC-type spermidine/putrescine transport system substrate-binding protein n=1 Tax=Loofah witches'-broom phytoplasma TaxID=35773 RepID=A0A975INT9_LOWBP|nr:extracellular solute-binding protein [Candidatus Phytoplasma luffae]QTX03261.1 ABC-type spermidine/putrescine transport system substrate-binding protein [Candidatus Phytoplasma luffae]